MAAGLALGVALMWALRPPAALRRHVVVAAGLGNAGNLPLVLVAALVRESGGKLFAGQVRTQAAVVSAMRGTPAPTS